MAARALSQAEIDAIAANGRVLLQKERAAKAPEIVNVGHAATMDGPIPLLWGETEFTVGPISYTNALRLQKAQMELARWATKPAETAEEVGAQVAFMVETLNLFWSLLVPKPPTNPFADATPWEVGHLIPFFCTCLTMQRGQSRLRTVSVSRSTTSMHSLSSSAPSRHG